MRSARIVMAVCGGVLLPLATSFAQGLGEDLPTLLDMQAGNSTYILPIDYTLSGGHIAGSRQGALAFGDFNDDGHDDVLIGGPRYSSITYPDSGSAMIVYGGQRGTPYAPENYPVFPATSYTFFSGDGSENQEMGSSVAAGDINGDGVDDVVLGAPGHSLDGAQLVGRAFVVFGDRDLPKDSFHPQNQSAVDSISIEGEEEFDQLGAAVATGDVNGDGFDDVILGAPVAGFGGVVYVIYGSADLDRLIDLPTGAETIIRGAANSDLFGISVASGDVNGDGYDDVIAGASQANITAPGRTYVIYGGPNLGGATIDLATAAGSVAMRIDGSGNNDHTGDSVASGDVNGDGFDDVIVGAPDAVSFTVIGTGEVSVVYGSTAPPAVVDLSDDPDTAGFTRFHGGAFDQRVGSSVAAGDINGDGLDDVILGANKAERPPNFSGNNNGTVFVVYGDAALPGQEIGLSSGNFDTALLARANGDWLGTSTAAGGDLMRNGFAGFASSAWRGNTSNGADTGYTAYALGGGTATTASATEAFHAGATQQKAFGGPLSPVVRTKLAFDSGSGGMATVTITRDNSGIANLPNLADVFWDVATTNTNWNNATVEFTWLPSEVSGLAESRFVVFRGDSASGPWEVIQGFTRDTTTNEIEVTVNELGFFVIAESPPTDVNGDGVINAVDIQRVINGALGINPNDLAADVNRDERIDALDVQETINAAMGVPAGEKTGLFQ